MRRIIFFIDGFNVYHALQKVPHFRKYKWLNYSALAKVLVSPKDQIVDILYFTAYTDWDASKKARHRLLVQALRMQGIKVIFGKFKRRDKTCSLCGRTYKTFEEKRTDVNMAITLFQTAMNNEFDTAILITGDSDLVPAVEAVKLSFPAKQIGLVIPIGRSAEELKNVCDFHIKMKEKHLKTCQLPDAILLDPAKNITLQRPATWV
jgi:uncharacterized LabA/DUF88 family protein